MKITLIPLIGLILVAAQAGGQEYPRWGTTFHSKKGDLPSREEIEQQTGCRVLDIDKDGLNDIVITSRNRRGAYCLVSTRQFGLEDLPDRPRP